MFNYLLERLGLEAAKSLDFERLDFDFPPECLRSALFFEPLRLSDRLLPFRFLSLRFPLPRFSETSTLTNRPLCLKSVKKFRTFSFNAFSVLKNEKLSFVSTLNRSSLSSSKTARKKSLSCIQSKPSFRPTLMKYRTESSVSCDPAP